jgi:transcriptional regulator with XRE-family HTH domain
MSAITDKMRDLRLQNHYKQHLVASHLKMRQPDYSKLETGKRKKIDVELLKKLAELYNVDLKYFIE